MANSAKAKKPMTKKETFKLTAYNYKDVDKHILAVTKSATSLKVKIHCLAVTVLKHWHDNPSAGVECVSKLNGLMAASPYHSNAFAKWVGLISGVEWSDETKAFFTHKDTKLVGKMFIQARDVPFWEVSPPAAPKPFLMKDELERILAKVEKHEKNPVEGDVFDVKAAKYIREAIKALG